MRRRYADAERIAFKSATRLECMMQDYPKELPATASVGFTVVNQARSGYSMLRSNDGCAVSISSISSQSRLTLDVALCWVRTHSPDVS